MPAIRLLNALLALFFRLLYTSFAWSYDLVAAIVSAGHWKEWVYSVLPYLQGKQILELGHGPGHLQARLVEHGYATYGLDASRQMGKIAHRRLSGQKQSHPPRLARGLAQALPYARQSFDSVIATFPTSYIIEAASLSEVYRVLRPNGVLLILLAAQPTGTKLSERATAWLFRITGEEGPDAHTAPRLENFFTQAGFNPQIQYHQTASAQLLFILARKPG